MLRFARGLVSKNKKRFKHDGFDLDLSYITENIVAMGFPAGDKSSGMLGLIEGIYRNHMKDVIVFLDKYHCDGYKIYNLCSERTYDVSLFDGKVASFPFDDHNCPPLRLIESFCNSAKEWLRHAIDNIVVVHCKAGKSRTGLMVCCLLLHLGYAPTAEEAMAFYNLKRTHDGKGLTLPSQQRYLKYYELELKNPEAASKPPRRKILRSIKLRNYGQLYPQVYIVDHYSERMLFSSKMLAENIENLWKDQGNNCAEFVMPFPVKLEADFKIKFKDKQGEHYIWLNTKYIEQNDLVLEAADLDRYKYRENPNWGLQTELVFADSQAGA